MNYPGGKGGIFHKLINLMPPHEVYIETHLGGGAVMRNKLRARRDIGIEIDPKVIELWHQNKQIDFELIHDDAINYLKSRQFTGAELIYCDPPYLRETRKKRVRLYKHEYTKDQHIELLELIKSLPCMVMISGYESALYKEALAGWHTHFYKVGCQHGIAVEWVWMNYPAPVKLHDYRYLGSNFRQRERIKEKSKRWVKRLKSMPLLERQALLSALHSAKEDTMPKKTMRRLNVGAFPLMSAIIDKLDLKTILSKHLRHHGNEKISTVDSLIMILFNIITGRRPMYDLSDWVRNIHPQCFGLDEFDGTVFNDDRFGRATEKIYDADRATIMTEVVLNAIAKFDINLDQLHNDSTTVKAYGDIPGETKTGLELKRGNSKDHRPDLKQLVYTLTISADGAIPIHYKTYPGNRTDDTTHIETWCILKKITRRSDFLYIADCKVCTKKQLKYITSNNGKVITMMPETWGEVEEFKNELRKQSKEKKEILRRPIPGIFNEIEYFYVFLGDHHTKREGYKIHWIFSSEKKKRDLKSREKALAKADRDLTDLLPKLNKRKLKTRQEIEERCISILNKRNVKRFFDFTIQEVKEKEIVQVGKGRPGPKTRYEERINTIYSLSWRRKKQELKSEKKVDGVFPLLSTDTKITAKEALLAYKYQPRLEKRFEQLKDVLLAAPMLFKKIERVEGIMFMFFLGLLVQALIEREVRKSMKKADIEKIFIYPEDRPAAAPTTSVILDRFENVSVYHLIEDENITQIFKDELTETQKTILSLLNIQPEKYWLNKI
jgi:transposase